MDSYTLPSEPHRDQTLFNFPVACAALTVHTLAVIGFAWMLYSDDRSDPEVIGIWILWCFLDVPNGIIALLVERFITRNFYRADFDTLNISLALHVGLLGGFQWFSVFGLWGTKQDSPDPLADQPEPNASLTEHVAPADLDNPYSAPNAQPSEQ